MGRYQTCPHCYRAWCGTCLEDNHSLTCDECSALICPECVPEANYITCHDCVERDVVDGGVQVCDVCYQNLRVYECCANAVDRASCTEHDGTRAECECGQMVCQNCADDGFCVCGEFREIRQ